MSMKNILIPMENHEAMQSALETALLLARRCDSYMEGFALHRAISELVGVDVAGISLKTYKQDIPEEAKQSREMFESFMQTHDVPRSRGRAGLLSFGWLDDAPAGDSFVGSYGRVFDVIVMSRPDASSTVLHNRAVESGLFESGRPILLSPASPPRQIATHALVAWNFSTEQARATALAMPLLQQASHVTVLTITGGTGVPGPTAEQMVRYLQRNGIAAETLTIELNDRNTGEAILATADD